jgi:alanyl aminopeptidase
MRAHHRPWSARPLGLVLLLGWSAGGGASAAQTAAAPAPAAADAPAEGKAELRLDTTVVPLAERLRLRLDPAASDYSGTAEVTLRVPAPVAAFRLHAEAMELAAASVRPLAGGEAVALEPHPVADGVVELRAGRSLAAGEHLLSVYFRQEYDAHSVGIYRVEQAGKHYVFTQLEAADARHSFPCWDEPSFKIPWTLELTVPAGLLAAANAPAAETTVAEPGWTTVRFAETPALPSYLVALAVGPFDVVDVPGLSVPGRILTPAGQGQLAGVAREQTPPLLANLERWFGGPYPFAKLDLVAVPEFWPGAMENPGLITFADRLLLTPPEGASAADRRDLAKVLAHELAHMWFGDLVTMAWWDDLWLNEAFADWMGNRIADETFPALGIAADELGGVQLILDADARPSSPAVRQPIRRAGDALSNVGIAYGKGRSVIDMVERWLGAETFRRGVQRYLAAHARGNAAADDLWGALAAASGRDVAAVMRGFLDQPGYPLVTVELVDATNGTVALAQERFHAAGVAVTPQRWRVPVVLAWSDGAGVKTREVLLDGERLTVELGGPVEWIFPNAGAAGYYRWRLGAAALAELAAAAPSRLQVNERIALLGNASGLLDAGLLGGDDYLRIVAAAVGDPDPAVVVVALEGLEKVEEAFVDGSVRQPFAAFVRRTVGPALARVDRLPRPGEPEGVALLRPRLLTWLAISGRDPELRAFAAAQADAYLADPKAVPPDVVSVLLRLSALDGDEARFETYRRRFEAAKDPGERAHFLRPLGYFERPELVERALAYSLRGPLRDREVSTVASTLRARPEWADRAFAWTREHWAEVVKRTPPELVPFYAGYAGGCSAERLAAAREFFTAPERRSPQLDVRLGRAADQVQQCIALREREGARVAALLRGESGAATLVPEPTAATTAKPGAAAPASATAAEVRLGDAVVPTGERLLLRLDPAAAGYGGTAEIALRVGRAVRSFGFHAEAMELGAVTLHSAAGAAIDVTATPAADDVIEVVAPSPLVPGDYRLRVDFRNDYGSRAVGLHHVATGGKHYLFTDFEPADAREAFPCFDEPGFKIPWRLELTVPAGLLAAANAPAEATRPAEDGWQTVTFAATPPLPTYLVAFAVGPFDVVDVPGMSVPGRILAVAGQGGLAGMAREMTPPLLAALERWFGQPYPYAKLDLVAVPEYASGAMENPGLITYLDRLLLTTPQGASLSERSDYASITAHELAHMWFGDLVTMRWWDDLWLNESFADWLGPKVADEVYPDLGVGTETLAAIHTTLASDARPSAPPVRRMVRAKDVFTNVDLTYSKGRAVLGMVEQWLGADTFRRGVRAYVTAHAHGNATAADLWQALATASGKDVAAVMGSFLDQPGHPLLTVEVVDPPRGVVEIAQQRFVALGSQAAAQSWQVPVVLKWSDGGAIETLPVLLTGARQRFELGRAIAWLFPNGGGRGYYRWRLPAPALTELAAKAEERLTVAERIALLGNAAGLLDAGAIAGDAYLGILAAAARDRDPDVLGAVLQGLERVQSAFVGTALRPTFAAYVRATLAPALARIGELPRAGEPAAVGLLRPKLLVWLGDSGRDPAVRRLAGRLVRDFLAAPESVDQGLVGAALEIAAVDGDAALFDTYRRRFETATSSEERGRFLVALGRFADPQLADRALAYTIGGPLRPQELRAVALAMAQDDAGRDRVLAWVQAHWTPLAQRLPPDRVPSLTRFAGGCSAERLEAGRRFFSAPERRAAAIDAQLDRVADQVAECLALRQREGGQVGAWLAARAASG